MSSSFTVSFLPPVRRRIGRRRGGEKERDERRGNSGIFQYPSMIKILKTRGSSTSGGRKVTRTGRRRLLRRGRVESRRRKRVTPRGSLRRHPRVRYVPSQEYYRSAGRALYRMIQEVFIPLCRRAVVSEQGHEAGFSKFAKINRLLSSINLNKRTDRDEAFCLLHMTISYRQVMSCCMPCSL